jgi:putative peptidoglycan lipid II flippase
MPRPSLGRALLGLLPLQIGVKAVEATFPLLLALWFGRNDRTDVYYFAWSVFTLVGALVFSAFQDSAVIPVLTELRRSRPTLLPVVRGSLLVHTVALAAALAVVFAGITAAWFGSRYTGDARRLALTSVPPFAIGLVALAVKTFLASVLNAEHRYRSLPVATGAGALVTLAVVWAAHDALSIVAIPVGSAAGEILAVLVLASSLRAGGIAVAPSFARPEPVRRIVRLVASEVGGAAVTRLNPVVDQLMAGLTAVAGGGTLLKLSADVASVPTSLLQAALLPILLTHLSEQGAAGDTARLRTTLGRTMGVVVAAMTLCAALMWVARAPLLELLLAHGAMDPGGIDRMNRLLPYHLVGLVPFGALLVLARAHVAIQNSRIMVSMGVLNALLNLVLDGALVRPLGLEGLALATSLTYAVVALVFAARLRGRLAPPALRPAVEGT